jgi:antitoxin VapB
MPAGEHNTKHRTRLFRNGNSQAVRIPKDIAFPRDDLEMEIERRGDSLIVRPVRQRLTGLARAFRALGPGFMSDGRDQPDVPDRAWDEGGR